MTSHTLGPLYGGTSANSPSFLLAALLAEGVVRPLAGGGRGYERADTAAAFLEWARALIGSNNKNSDGKRNGNGNNSSGNGNGRATSARKGPKRTAPPAGKGEAAGRPGGDPLGGRDAGRPADARQRGQEGRRCQGGPGRGRRAGPGRREPCAV